MSRDTEKAGSAARNSCPLCGSGKFTWGVARGAYPFTFKPDKAGWFSGGLKVKARKCDSCRNIQFFAAPE
jgi:hypothetical protein